MEARYLDGPTLTLSSDRSFLWRLCISAWLVRFVIIVAYALTDAIGILRLSPDSERYHREGIQIMNLMSYGDFNWPNWLDNGWFQFTGLVYYLITPSSFIMQLFNITVGTLTIIPLFLMVRQMTNDVRVQRFFAILIAFFPSLVYWSTLMLKDPISILAIALITYGVFTLRLRMRWSALMLLVLGLAILAGTRTYLFVVLTMVIPAAFLLFPVGRSVIPWRALAVPVLIGALPMLIGYGYFASGAFEKSVFFDLDYINHVRVKMGDHGGGAIFNEGGVHVWGDSLLSDIWAALVTVFTIFIPVNPFAMSGVRQFIALPFVGIMIYLAVPLYSGGLALWRARRLTIPIIIITGAVLVVYVGGTTNAGALFRWTTQIMPYFLIAIALATFQRQKSILARFANSAVMLFSQPRYQMLQAY